MSVAIPPAFKILLVEDNRADAYLFSHALLNAGLNHQLTVIEDGSVALAFAKGNANSAYASVPDLIVLDLNLPKAGGIAVLEALRNNECLAVVPVCILSSSASPKERAAAESYGILRFLTKPLELNEFLHIGHIVKDLLLSRAVSRTEASSSH